VNDQYNDIFLPIFAIEYRDLYSVMHQEMCTN